MKPAPFAYVKATSVYHAVGLLTQYQDARVLAGGQSLIATLNMRLSAPRLLVDINGLDDLMGIAVADRHVRIGALVRQAQAERSADIAANAPLIAKALPHIAHPAIRNRGTIGGSIAFADPAAELPACLVALNGEIEIVGPRGHRVVAADDFFQELFETALAADEILTAVRLPLATSASRCGFAELARRHGDYALVGLAATARADGKALAGVRLAFFGVGATPVRATGAETAIAAGDIDAAVAALADDLDPPSDIQASAAARLRMAGVLVRRVAAQLAEPRP